MIEIGHGFGLGAERSFGKMTETDATYICCLAGSLDGALFGMFANANQDPIAPWGNYGLSGHGPVETFIDKLTRR